MNEQIKSLMAQAGIHQPERFDAIDGSNQLQKFAELIVKECMIIVKQEAMLTDYVPAKMNEYAGKRLYRAFAEIEKHFGVEE